MRSLRGADLWRRSFIAHCAVPLELTAPAWRSRNFNTLRHNVNSFAATVYSYFITVSYVDAGSSVAGSVATQCAIAEPPRGYQRSMALAQVKPEPKAVMETSVPGRSRPSRPASANSIGIEPAEQLP